MVHVCYICWCINTGLWVYCIGLLVLLYHKLLFYAFMIMNLFADALALVYMCYCFINFYCFIVDVYVLHVVILYVVLCIDYAVRVLMWAMRMYTRCK